MRKFLMLMLCLFSASTLVISVSCKRKEETPPASIEEFAPAEEAAPELPMEFEPAEEELIPAEEELIPAEEELEPLEEEVIPAEEELEPLEEEVIPAEEELEPEEVAPAEEALPILAFFDESVEEGRLEGRGLDALKHMIETAGGYIESDRIGEACHMLTVAYKATPDYAEGEAAPELASMIEDLRKSLGCEEPE